MVLRCLESVLSFLGLTKALPAKSVFPESQKITSFTTLHIALRGQMSAQEDGKEEKLGGTTVQVRKRCPFFQVDVGRLPHVRVQGLINDRYIGILAGPCIQATLFN